MHFSMTLNNINNVHIWRYEDTWVIQNKEKRCVTIFSNTNLLISVASKNRTTVLNRMGDLAIINIR